MTVYVRTQRVETEDERTLLLRSSALSHEASSSECTKCYHGTQHLLLKLFWAIMHSFSKL